jgi:hypothetical protein
VSYTGGTDGTSTTSGMTSAVSGATFGSGGTRLGAGGATFASGGIPFGTGGFVFVGTGGAAGADATSTGGNNCQDCHTQEYLDANVPGWESLPPRLSSCLFAIDDDHLAGTRDSCASASATREPASWGSGPPEKLVCRFEGSATRMFLQSCRQGLDVVSASSAGPLVFAVVQLRASNQRHRPPQCDID